MDLSVILKRLGFGKNAHKVYVALLKNKQPISVTDISRLAKIDRPEVYRNLVKLLKENFVKKVCYKKRSYYEAEDIRRIRTAFQVVSKDLEPVLNNLEKKQGQELPSEVRYFKGFKGIQAVFDDVIAKTPKKETFYRYTSERDLASVNKYLSTDYRKNRDKKKIERLVISNPLSGRQKKSRLERFIKFIPPETDLFDQNIIQIIYDDYLAFINLNKEEAIIINDQALADFQKVIFKQLYKKI